MFKKLKAFYKSNRVYSILMIISIICILAILIGVVLYFLGQTNKDKYGYRLEGIEKVEIKESKLSDIEKKISENEIVNSTDVTVKGKLIYVTITLNSGTHAESEAIAQSSLELFNEEEKSFYDLQYIVDNNDKSATENFPIMGYMKAGNSIIKWTNYILVGE